MLKAYFKEFYILTLLSITIALTLGLPTLPIVLTLFYIDSRARDKTSFNYDVKLVKAKKNFNKSNKKKVPQIMSKQYTKYLQSETWKALRHRAIHRDGYKCTNPECQSRNNLQIHHISYGGIFNMNFQLNQLKTLCRDCHDKIHNR